MGKLKGHSGRGGGWLRCIRSLNSEGSSVRLKGSEEVNQEIVLLNLYLNSLEKKIDLIRTFRQKCRAVGWKEKNTLRAMSPLKNIASNKYDDIIQHLISAPEKKKKKLMEGNRPPRISDVSSAAVIPINGNKKPFFVAHFVAQNDFIYRNDQQFYPVECHIARRIQVVERFETHRSSLQHSTCIIRYIQGETLENNQLEIEFSNGRLQGQTTGVIQLKEMDCSSNIIQSEMIGRIVCYLLGMIPATAVPDTVV